MLGLRAHSWTWSSRHGCQHISHYSQTWATLPSLGLVHPRRTHCPIILHQRPAWRQEQFCYTLTLHVICHFRREQGGTKKSELLSTAFFETTFYLSRAYDYRHATTTSGFEMPNSLFSENCTLTRRVLALRIVPFLSPTLEKCI